ncbi:hypothetical protein Cgig2_006291 [Carnegiea gigantea]|uniref:RRM domain-containing protein n=1 Tax=Carnegiea gigantea TaxID=171969 RepID=A0A9Q1QDK9_9CARY|nr:hypothetical protein Cgig2_006291 [Carnegiea gigantea]
MPSRGHASLVYSLSCRRHPSTLSLGVADAVCYSLPAFLTSHRLLRCSLSVDLSRRLDADAHQSIEPLSRRLLEPLSHPVPRTSQSKPQNSRLTIAARRLLGATHPTVALYLSRQLLGISVDAGGHQGLKLETELDPLEVKSSKIRHWAAYIEFYDAHVPMAIALSGQLLLGQLVMVKPSEAEKNLVQSTSSTGSSVTGPYGPTDRKLYMENLHFDMTEQQLCAIFEPFGPVELVQLPFDLDAGLGYMAFNVMQEEEFIGSNVDWSSTKGVRFSPRHK